MCNAGQAYLFSNRGISFAPWSSYDQASYAPPFLDLVQAAVTRHLSGTVTSALLGECLGQGKPAVGASVVIENCGSGAADQQWSFADGKLKSGSRCATVSGSKATVTLAACRAQKAQQWVPFGRSELRNPADGKCLVDPGSSLRAGTAVKVSKCVNAKSQTWWQS
jgi:Ricin-type beta-trefoil lectin domain